MCAWFAQVSYKFFGSKENLYSLVVFQTSNHGTKLRMGCEGKFEFFSFHFEVLLTFGLWKANWQ